MRFLQSHMNNPSLIKHGIAVAAAMRAYARKFGEDEELWRITGLLHDVDYEQFPDISEHGKRGGMWLEEAGYPAEVVHAVVAHNDYHQIPRDDLLSRALFACDEITGLITATALVRPEKKLAGLTSSTVRKKMKDKAFARGVNRNDIVAGASELGVDLDTHIDFVIQAMTSEADALGL